MARIRFLLLFVVVHLSGQVLANGGPIDGSAVYKTGDIVLINNPDIQLIHEDLHFRIDGDYSIVTVKYLLENNKYSSSEITYGFPVEFIRNELHYDLEWQEDYLPEIAFSLNDTPLTIKHQIDNSIQQVADRNYGGEVDMRRSWHVVDFELKKSERATLKVRYKVKNGYEDWATTKSFFPTFAERQMTYDLSPAKHWGDGTIESLNVTLDARDLLRHGGSLVAEGLPFKVDGDIYSVKMASFDLKNAGEIHISYDNSKRNLSDFIREHRVAQKHILSIDVSSQLKGNYHVDHLLDFDFATAWVEGKPSDGVGEMIEISLKDYRLSAIGLINGYTKSEGTYTTNNRVKRIRVNREIVDRQNPSRTRIESQEFSLEDLPYQELSNENFGGNMSIIGDYGDGFVNVRKITLTILEVYKGTKYPDTCLSEIVLMGYQ